MTRPIHIRWYIRYDIYGITELYHLSFNGYIDTYMNSELLLIGKVYSLGVI